ncbi:MAG TPA: hypothetical protein VJZ00_13595 [Thermoanaerobaculia bacterium]|nr:hypothetical protein [Thermoanaerobaculia bacterium]
MSDTALRTCVTCGANEDVVRLEPCSICRRSYCADCAHRAGHGRRFCSPECARAYYFAGEPDDNEDFELDD